MKTASTHTQHNQLQASGEERKRRLAEGGALSTVVKSHALISAHENNVR